MKAKQSLTVKEALEQGYTLYGYELDGYQSLSNISDLGPEEFEREEEYGRQIVLADKEPVFVSVKGKQLARNIADDLMDSEDVMGDDTNEISDLVNGAVDWEDIAARINAALLSRPYYRLTEIKLVL